MTGWTQGSELLVLLEGALIVQRQFGTFIIPTMERVTVVNYCLGLLGLLLLQGVLNVEGRSIFNPGKCAKLCFWSIYDENDAEDFACDYCTL